MTEQKTNGVSYKRASIPCPFCHVRKSERISFFGQNLLTAQYYCHSCHTPFEAVRWHEIDSEKDLDEN